MSIIVNDPSQTYYDVFGVSPTASLHEIRQSFHRLALQYHPDVNPGDRTALKTFQTINHIYQILSDPVARDRYDQTIGIAFGRHSTTNSYHPENIRPESIRTAAAWYQNGLQLSQQGCYEKAITAYSRALTLNSELIDAYNQRGFAHYKLNQLTESFTDYGEAISRSPQQATSYYYRGLARFKLGYTQSAIADFTQAIAIDPNHGQSYYQRGMAYSELSQRHQARNDFKTAHHHFLFQNNPILAQDAQSAYRNLGYVAIPLIVLRYAKLVPGDVLMVLSQLSLHPINGIINAFDRLSPQRAIAVSTLLALWFSGCLSYSLLSNGPHYSTISLVSNTPSQSRLILLGLILFGLLILVSAFGRWLNNRQRTLSGDIFIAGVALFPLSILLLCSTQTSSPILIPVGLVCWGYECVLLYKGERYISGLGQGIAMAWVVVMLTGLLLFFTLII